MSQGSPRKPQWKLRTLNPLADVMYLCNRQMAVRRRAGYFCRLGKVQTSQKKVSSPPAIALMCGMRAECPRESLP